MKPLPISGSEMYILIRHDRNRYTMSSYHFPNINLGQFVSGRALTYSQKLSGICQTVHYYPDDIKTLDSTRYF